MKKPVTHPKLLESEYWKKVRWHLLRVAHFQCETCGIKKRKWQDFHIHHMDYSILGREHLYLNRLLVVCDKCHKKIHSKRDEKYKNLDPYRNKGVIPTLHWIKVNLLNEAKQVKESKKKKMSRVSRILKNFRGI